MKRVLRYVSGGLSIKVVMIIVMAAVPAVETGAQTLYESYYTSDGVVAANYTNTTWIGQSFTAISDHTVTSVRIRIGKDGSPGDITVALMECWTHDWGGGYVSHNPYGVIAVNPAKWPHVKHGLAGQFIEFLCSPGAQEMIADYKVDGEALFHPWPAPAGGG